MKIHLTLGSSQYQDFGIVTLEELGVTKEKFLEMNEDEIRELLQSYIDKNTKQPYWVLDRYNIEG